MKIDGWVRAAREGKGLTQEQLGAALGVSKSNISAWENGLHEPSYTQMRKIAELTRRPLPDGAMVVFSEELVERLRHVDADQLLDYENGLRGQLRMPFVSFTQATAAKTAAEKSSRSHPKRKSGGGPRKAG